MMSLVLRIFLDSTNSILELMIQKNYRTTKVIAVDLEDDTNVWTRFHGNSFNICFSLNQCDVGLMIPTSRPSHI